jgi:cytochrome c oxidase subunit 4
MNAKTGNPWLRLLFAWILMLVALGISVGVAVVFPGIGIWHSTINLLLAVVLVLLVMSFYMHLSTSEPLLRLIAGTGFFWISLLFIFALADYFSRP